MKIPNRPALILTESTSTERLQLAEEEYDDARDEITAAIASGNVDLVRKLTRRFVVQAEEYADGIIRAEKWTKKLIYWGRELKREINELHIEYTQALGRKHSAAKAEEYVRLAVLPECDHVAWMLGMASALPGFALADLLRWPRKRRETKIREYLNYVTNLDVDTIRKKIKRYQKSIVIPKPSPVALDWIRECLARHSFKSRQ